MNLQKGMLPKTVMQTASSTCLMREIQYGTYLNNICKRYSTHHKHKKPVHTPSHYTVLGVPPKATTAQIKHAYYRLSKIYHPDRNKSPAAQIKFQELQTAYEILSNPKLRSQYDGGMVKHHGPVFRSPVVEHPKPWLKASHPTGRAHAFNFDEHMQRHYRDHFIRHQRIKLEVEHDRKLERENPTAHRHDDAWLGTPWGVTFLSVLLVGLIAHRTISKRRRQAEEAGFNNEIDEIKNR